MKAKTLSPKRRLRLGIATLFLPALAFASAVPEPPLILYGSVTNTSGSSVLTNGAVAWSVAGGGSSTTVSATIASVNGQSFYIARIPFETRFAGNVTFSPSANRLLLTASPMPFTRCATVNGFAATLVPPASANFTFSNAERRPNVAAGVRRLAASAEFRWWNAEWKQERGSALTTRRGNELPVVNYEGRKV